MLGGGGIAELFRPVLGGGGTAEHEDSAVTGGGGIAEQEENAIFGGGGTAEQEDSAVTGGGGIAERESSAVFGGGGIAEQEASVVAGGGGIAEQDSAVVGGGGICDPERAGIFAPAEPSCPDSIPPIVRLIRRQIHGNRRRTPGKPAPPDEHAQGSSDVHTTTRVRSPRNRSRANSSGSPERA